MVSKVLIIAEAGVNHNGDFEMAKKLVEAAAEAGADFVKFQTFKTDKVISKLAKKAAYQVTNVNDGNDSQYEMVKKLEMPVQWHYDLIEHCKANKISFLSTGFDEDSVDLLNELETPLFKIPSGEITNKPYLQHIARKGKPVIISTGMATLEEVRAALAIIVAEGISVNDIIVMHCNTEYPTPYGDVNLLAMNTIGKELGVKIGYSDHTQGIEVSIAAVALGATVIEKHFTLDRTLPGPDHLASLEPKELSALVRAVRNIELAIGGDGEKKPSPSEIHNKIVARKSIHLARSVERGQVITADMLIMKRPGDGISPMDIDKVLGKKFQTSVLEDAKLEWMNIL